MRFVQKTVAVGVALSLAAFVPVVPAAAQDDAASQGAAAAFEGAAPEGQDAPYTPSAGQEAAAQGDALQAGGLASSDAERASDAAQGADDAASGADASRVDADAAQAADAASEQADAQEEGFVYDKADFYDDDDQWAAPVPASGMSFYSARSARSAYSVEPVQLSDDMKYFAKYESSRNYDQGFGAGDGYHALGFYQFDHRYGLKEFLAACHAYDSSTYAMFAQFEDYPDAAFKASDAIRRNGSFTDLGVRLEDAWHAAYRANPQQFAQLQDGWAYRNYYLPAERYLASRGIHIADRADCVKGLCWGMSNLFGVGGWRKFVGGVTSGYDWSGTWRDSYDWPGCGLNDAMSDQEFVTTLCNYVVNNVAVFYKAQPQYHQGWQNRYRNELKDCMSMLGSWVAEGSEWKYYVGGTYLANRWKYIGRTWYWFDADGYAARDGMRRIGGELYCFDAGCAMLADRWSLQAGSWYWLTASGAAARGWQAVGDTWYYLDPDSSVMKTGWQNVGGTWYYLAESGAMRTGWIELGGTWYYLEDSGAMATGWIRPGGGAWYFLSDSGAMATGWQTMGAYRFFFDGSGAMAEGWRDMDGKRYHFSDFGDVDTGWTSIGGSWYWFGDDGAMAAGWIRPGGTWYYLDAEGVMQTGWQLIDGTWYWLEDSGAMATGWKNLGGTWYYLAESGAMRTGWIELGGRWYCLSESGAMEHDRWIGDYYVGSDGAMAVDAWIGGYYVNADGKWVPGASR